MRSHSGTARSRYWTGSVTHSLQTQGWVSLELDTALLEAYQRLVGHARWFFAQPADVKRRLDIRSSVGHRGWVPPDEVGDYEDEGSRRYEALDIGRPPAEDDRSEHRLRGPNVWPRSPRGQDLRIEAETLFDVLSRMAEDLGDIICDDLGIDPSTLRSLRREPVSQLRLIGYFDSPDVTPEAAAKPAMGAHTDYEFFTFLFQSAPGVQYLDGEHTWADAPHGPVLNVFVGDMLEVFSNGRYRSAMHRASPDVSSDRVSIPFFAGADFSALVRPAIPGDRTEGVRFGEHLMSQLYRDFPYLRHSSAEGAINLSDIPSHSSFEAPSWRRIEKQGVTTA